VDFECADTLGAVGRLPVGVAASGWDVGKAGKPYAGESPLFSQGLLFRDVWQFLGLCGKTGQNATK